MKCVSNIGDVVDDEECNMKLRPNDIENCDMGPCAKSWFLTEWSERVSARAGRAGFLQPGPRAAGPMHRCRALREPHRLKDKSLAENRRGNFYPCTKTEGLQA